MQGTRVRALVWEGPTCRGANKPGRHNYWACALEPIIYNQRKPERSNEDPTQPKKKKKKKKALYV